MGKEITNIFINSAVAVANKNAVFDGTKIYSLNINIPPIIINNRANLKVANLCHCGTGHSDNIIIMRIDNIQVDYSKYIANDPGTPAIIATTFNNTRNLYEENDIPLSRQTINEIKLSLSTLNASSISSFTGLFSITSGGTGYLTGQILKFTGGGDDMFASIVASSGVITSINPISYSESYSSTPTLSTYINGSGAILTATVSGGVITAIVITNAGLGYKANQALAFTSPGSGANITIATVSATGAILTFTITSGGTGYTTPTVSVTATTQTQTATITPQMNYGVVSSGMVNTMNFCMSLKIEEDINDGQ